MSTFARRRIVQDLAKVMKEPPPGIVVKPYSDNIMICHAIISGPIDTYWEAGNFHVLIKFTEQYPTEPPIIQFLSKMFHPNIFPDGNICLDILQNKWSAMFAVSSALASVQSLLADPYPESPANTEAANIFKEDLVLYNKLVLECVEDSWCVSSLNLMIEEE